MHILSTLFSLKNLEYFGKLLILGVFVYFGLESILQPTTFSSLVPGFLSTSIDPTFLVTVHGAIEIICALFILCNLGGLLPYLVLIFSFVFVTLSVSGMTQIRDIAILGSLLVLVAGYMRNRKVIQDNKKQKNK